MKKGITVINAKFPDSFSSNKFHNLKDNDKQKKASSVYKVYYCLVV